MGRGPAPALLCSLSWSHGAAWSCESREKRRQEDGGLRAGNREHGSSWETLRRPQCRGRAAAGAAAPPRCCAFLQETAFLGAASAWEKFQGCLCSAAVAGTRHRGSGNGEWGFGCSCWAWEGIAVIYTRVNLRAGCWEQSRLMVWVQPWSAHPWTPALENQFWALGASVSPSAELPHPWFWLAGPCGKQRFPCPMHGGKSNHIRSVTCCGSSPVSHRVLVGVTATALF